MKKNKSLLTKKMVFGMSVLLASSSASSVNASSSLASESSSKDHNNDQLDIDKNEIIETENTNSKNNDSINDDYIPSNQPTVGESDDSINDSNESNTENEILDPANPDNSDIINLEDVATVLNNVVPRLTDLSYYHKQSGDNTNKLKVDLVLNGSGYQLNKFSKFTSSNTPNSTIYTAYKNADNKEPGLIGVGTTDKPLTMFSVNYAYKDYNNPATTKQPVTTFGDGNDTVLDSTKVETKKLYMSLSEATTIKSNAFKIKDLYYLELPKVQTINKDAFEIETISSSLDQEDENSFINITSQNAKIEPGAIKKLTVKLPFSNNKYFSIISKSKLPKSFITETTIAENAALRFRLVDNDYEEGAFNNIGKTNTGDNSKGTLFLRLHNPKEAIAEDDKPIKVDKMKLELTGEIGKQDLAKAIFSNVSLPTSYDITITNKNNDSAKYNIRDKAFSNIRVAGGSDSTKGAGALTILVDPTSKFTFGQNVFNDLTATGNANISITVSGNDNKIEENKNLFKNILSDSGNIDITVDNLTSGNIENITSTSGKIKITSKSESIADNLFNLKDKLSSNNDFKFFKAPTVEFNATNITSIGESAFKGFKFDDSFNLNISFDKLTTINESAFENATHTTDSKKPFKLSSTKISIIGDMAFKNFTSNGININLSTKSKLNINSEAFNGMQATDGDVEISLSSGRDFSPDSDVFTNIQATNGDVKISFTATSNNSSQNRITIENNRFNKVRATGSGNVYLTFNTPGILQLRADSFKGINSANKFVINFGDTKLTKFNIPYLQNLQTKVTAKQIVFCSQNIDTLKQLYPIVAADTSGQYKLTTIPTETEIKPIKATTEIQENETWLDTKGFVYSGAKINDGTTKFLGINDNSTSNPFQTQITNKKAIYGENKVTENTVAKIVGPAPNSNFNIDVVTAHYTSNNQETIKNLKITELGNGINPVFDSNANFNNSVLKFGNAQKVNQNAFNLSPTNTPNQITFSFGNDTKQPLVIESSAFKSSASGNKLPKVNLNFKTLNNLTIKSDAFKDVQELNLELDDIDNLDLQPNVFNNIEKLNITLKNSPSLTKATFNANMFNSPNMQTEIILDTKMSSILYSELREKFDHYTNNEDNYRNINITFKVEDNAVQDNQTFVFLATPEENVNNKLGFNVKVNSENNKTATLGSLETNEQKLKEAQAFPRNTIDGSSRSVNITKDNNNKIQNISVSEIHYGRYNSVTKNNSVTKSSRRSVDKNKVYKINKLSTNNTQNDGGLKDSDFAKNATLNFENVTELQANLFKDFTNIGTITIDRNNDITIGDNAFNGATGLTSINSVNQGASNLSNATSIGDNAFRGTNIGSSDNKAVILSNKLKHLGTGAFNDIQNLNILLNKTFTNNTNDKKEEIFKPEKFAGNNSNITIWIEDKTLYEELKKKEEKFNENKVTLKGPKDNIPTIPTNPPNPPKPLPKPEPEPSSEPTSTPIIPGGGGSGGGGAGGGGASGSGNKSNSISSSSTSSSTETTTSKLGLTDVDLPNKKPKNEFEGFIDVPDNHWAKDEIEKLHKLGIVVGYQNMFYPSLGTKRADMAIMFVELLGLTGDGVKYNFDDVPNHKYYANYVSIARRYGIVNGYLNKFQPENTISRQDLMVIVTNILKSLNVELDYSIDKIKQFSDYSSISFYAKDSVAAVANLGFVQGYNGKINPKNPITRAESAVILSNLYDFINNKYSEDISLLKEQFLNNATDKQNFNINDFNTEEFERINE